MIPPNTRQRSALKELRLNTLHNRLWSYCKRLTSAASDLFFATPKDLGIL